MKTILAFLMALFTFTSFGANVYFKLSDFTSTGASNRKAVIKPLSLPTGDTNGIYSLDWRTFSTSSTGDFWVSNMYMGLYSVELQAPPTLTKFTIGIPSTNGTVLASQCITSPTNTAWPPGGYAWSISASDARYLSVNSPATNVLTSIAGDGIDVELNGLQYTISTAVPFQPQSANLDGWSLIGTNELGAAGSIGNGSAATNLYLWGATVMDTITGDGSGLVNIQGANIVGVVPGASQTPWASPIDGGANRLTNASATLNGGLGGVIIQSETNKAYLTLRRKVLPGIYEGQEISFDANGFNVDRIKADGSQLTDLNASQLTSGTMPHERLPSTAVTNGQVTVSLGDNSALSIGNTGPDTYVVLGGTLAVQSLTGFSGDGRALTSLDGANLQDASVNQTKFDYATTVWIQNMAGTNAAGAGSNAIPNFAGYGTNLSLFNPVLDSREVGNLMRTNEIVALVNSATNVALELANDYSETVVNAEAVLRRADVLASTNTVVTNLVALITGATNTVATNATAQLLSTNAILAASINTVSTNGAATLVLTNTALVAQINTVATNGAATLILTNNLLQAQINTAATNAHAELVATNAIIVAQIVAVTSSNAIASINGSGSNTALINPLVSGSLGNVLTTNSIIAGTNTIKQELALKQTGSVNLTNWSGIITTSKQGSSAQLSEWTLVWPYQYQTTNVNLTTLGTGLLNIPLVISNNLTVYGQLVVQNTNPVTTISNLVVTGTLTTSALTWPTNTPTDAYVLTATGTGGGSAWKVSTGSSGYWGTNVDGTITNQSRLGIALNPTNRIYFGDVATGAYLQNVTGTLGVSGPFSVPGNLTVGGSISGGAVGLTNISVTGIAATGISATKYLKGDGTWDTPAGGGGITFTNDVDANGKAITNLSGIEIVGTGANTIGTNTYFVGITNQYLKAGANGLVAGADVSGGAATNVPVLVAGTNIGIVVDGFTNTISVVTNGLATELYVQTQTNGYMKAAAVGAQIGSSNFLTSASSGAPLNGTNTWTGTNDFKNEVKFDGTKGIKIGVSSITNVGSTLYVSGNLNMAGADLTANSFVGNGGDLTGLDASQLTGGTVATNRLPAILGSSITGNAATVTTITSAQVTNALPASLTNAVTGPASNATGGTVTNGLASTNYVVNATNVLWAPARLAAGPQQSKIPAVASGALTWEWVDMTPATTWATMQALAMDKILTNNHAAAVTFVGAVTLPASTALVTPAIGAATATSLVASGIVTAQGFDSPTNVWVVNASMGMGTNAFYSSGAATIGIPGILNGPTSTERYGELTIMATGTVTFTNFAGFKTSDFLTTRTLTNGNVMVVGVSVIPGLCTNMALVQFR